MNLPVTASTGAKCPVSGLWKVLGNITTTQPIARGDPMPEYCSTKVKWQLLYQI